MSHIIDFSPDAIEQQLRHLGALAMACACATTKDGQPALQLRLMAGCEMGADGHLYKNGQRVTEGDAHYRSWKDDHGGKLVGDWPLPKGMTEAQVGNNAIAVVELTEAAQAEVAAARGKYGGSDKPYEVGVIPHVNNQTGEVTYSLTHDFYAGGYGLERYVGATEVSYQNREQKVKSAHGDLLMFYQMMCARISAEEAGHSIEFHKETDGTYYAVVDQEGVGVES